MSLPEVYKYRQSGLGIIRKKYTWESIRRLSFQEEMVLIGESPIEFPPNIIPESRDKIKN